ncbi:hypothetical protein MKY34_19620 [Sporosarcina sp. FSL K6-1522]|uniref:hypothetical protein n=1 Tax=Sporosarcina sp. FSL K6-1522 TaxID=2921554 RepID=UPI00315A867F
MKVTLKIKSENTVESVQHEVEEIDLFQFQKALGVIKDVFEMTQKDESLKGLFAELFNEDDSDSDEGDARFLSHAVGAFEVLLINIPHKAFELLSATSGIKLETLMSQKVNDVFDIYDAVIEVNDLEKLIGRAKKSLAVTKAKMSFMKIAKKATGAAMASPLA